MGSGAQHPKTGVLQAAPHHSLSSVTAGGGDNYITLAYDIFDAIKVNHNNLLQLWEAIFMRK